MKLDGVTQVRLSEAMGIAQSQISEDVNGKFSAISLDKARAYAKFFGCTVEDLFPVREVIAS
jgi:transcriptional regulator with XRE-family HTH domain